MPAVRVVTPASSRHEAARMAAVHFRTLYPSAGGGRPPWLQGSGLPESGVELLFGPPGGEAFTLKRHRLSHDVHENTST